jgi:hypothetical protein
VSELSSTESHFVLPCARRWLRKTSIGRSGCRTRRGSLSCERRATRAAAPVSHDRIDISSRFLQGRLAGPTVSPVARAARRGRALRALNQSTEAALTKIRAGEAGSRRPRWCSATATPGAWSRTRSCTRFTASRSIRTQRVRRRPPQGLRLLQDVPALFNCLGNDAVCLSKRTGTGRIQR